MTKDKQQHSKPTDALKDTEQKLNETMADLQRTRADFENYRKRVDLEKEQLKMTAQATTILKLLPVIDNIDRALNHLPEHLKDDDWAKSVTNLTKNLEKTLESMKLAKIGAAPGAPFDPELHHAIQMDETDGEHEVIAEELQAGYTLDGSVIRHSLVKVTRTNELETVKKEEK